LTAARLRNLFADLPASLPQELIEVLLDRDHVRLERIVSTGQSTPPDTWYDQNSTEWVIVLRGSAVLRFEDEAEPVVMREGDYVEIAPHRRHRVERTDPNEPTVWLAIHY
jgi:cupin 2 domain-containing protein